MSNRGDENSQTPRWSDLVAKPDTGTRGSFRWGFWALISLAIVLPIMFFLPAGEIPIWASAATFVPIPYLAVYACRCMVVVPRALFRRATNRVKQ
jgi:hypothetical protein